MAHAITPSLRASLERLKHAGAINGLCLAWRRRVRVSLMPYVEFRVEQVIQTLNDARDHFQSNGTRAIDSVWMGFLDVHVLAVFAGDVCVVALHARQEESDFLTGIIKTFLNDTQLLIAAALSPTANENGEENGDWLPKPEALNPNQTNVM